uniref:Ycf36 n=1 Tax=Gloeochaete wittrockiana TaxID=38269 RepID=A0A3G1IW58_9EUKA|nr:hypothetical protein [Gloeochaete wittrockiana]ASQ40263.1 hypothetical protein [Gloeochaete wittrockiana]
MNINGCPVSFEQRPINEYKKVKKEKFLFIKKIIKNKETFNLFFIIFFIMLLYIIYICDFEFIIKYNEYFETILLICFSITILLLGRLYFNSLYIAQRLLSASIKYEESGWYNGQIWTKFNVLTIRDRLIIKYCFEPLIINLSQFIHFFLLIFLILFF